MARPGVERAPRLGLVGVVDEPQLVRGPLRDEAAEHAGHAVAEDDAEEDAAPRAAGPAVDDPERPHDDRVAEGDVLELGLLRDDDAAARDVAALLLPRGDRLCPRNPFNFAST